MPEYRFKCEKCTKSFDVVATLAEYEEKAFKCPKCNSKKVKQVLTAFAPNTSKHVTIPKSSKKKKRKKLPNTEVNRGW